MSIGRALLIIIGIVLLAVGIFYAVTPHDYHITYGTGFALAHEIHQLIGIFAMLAAFIAFWLSKRLK